MNAAAPYVLIGMAIAAFASTFIFRRYWGKHYSPAVDMAVAAFGYIVAGCCALAAVALWTTADPIFVDPKYYNS